MKQRAALMNARLAIRSAAGEGTDIQLQVDLA
jgi:signal transduction histidine kinase